MPKIYVSATSTRLLRGMSTPAILATIASLYPCLCLCFGSLQITITTPDRLIIRHLAQRGFTDALTFIAISPIRRGVLRLLILETPHRDCTLPAYYFTRLLDLLQSFDYPASRQIEGRKGQRHTVARNDANSVQPQFIIQTCSDCMAVVELYPPRTIRCRLGDLAFNLDFALLFCQRAILTV